MHCSRVQHVVVALVAAFAFSAVAAGAAQAEEAPSWYRESEKLAEGKTHYITAKAYSKAFTLTAAGIKVSCESVKLKEGVILGSNAGNPGTNDEIIEFSGGCTIEGDGTGCKVVEPIVTRNVKSELVESEKGEKGSLLMEFFPEKGATFTTLHFEGSGCTVKETLVTGKVAGEVFTDPNDKELGEQVKFPLENQQAESWLINFPAIPITSVWLIKGGVGETVKTELTAFTEPATLTGTTLVSLANGKHEAEETFWGFSVAIVVTPTEWRVFAPTGTTNAVYKNNTALAWAPKKHTLTVVKPPLSVWTVNDKCSGKTIPANGGTCSVEIKYAEEMPGQEYESILELEGAPNVKLYAHS